MNSLFNNENDLDISIQSIPNSNNKLCITYGDATRKMPCDNNYAGLYPIKGRLAPHKIIEIKSSNIKKAGRGVFVKNDYPVPFTTICYYEGYQKPLNRSLSDFETNYMIGVGDDLIIGYFQPRSETGVAQLINDSSKPNFNDFQEQKTYKDKLLYTVQQLLKYNKTFDSCNVMPSYYNEKTKQLSIKSPLPFMSIKPILQGEELYLYYDMHYWINSEYQSGPIELVCLLVGLSQIFREADSVIDPLSNFNINYENIYYECYKKLNVDKIQLLQKIIDNIDLVTAWNFPTPKEIEAITRKKLPTIQLQFDNPTILPKIKEWMQITNCL